LATALSFGVFCFIKISCKITIMVRVVVKVFFWGLLGITLFGVVFFLFVTRDLPDPALLSNRQVFQSTKIYDRTGEVLLYEIHGEENRTTIPYEEIPDYVKQATVVVEDEGFYSHAAIDVRGVVRAFWINLKRGQVSQGGSTITQQLAKKAFLSDERTITRKAKELVLASRLEKSFSKDEILNLYLNQVPYGGNAYGIEAAAQTFFEKSAKEITLAEAALLASLPNAPSYYSPWGYHVDELLSRKDFIIEKMFKGGYIDEEEKERAKNQELIFAERTDIIRSPHFVIAVQEYLNKKYGEDFVQTAGLEVITTLDWDLQQLAEKVVLEGALRNEELYGGKNGALVAEDPKTGQILAMVGSRDYFDTEYEGNFNVATQGLRQPGSTMKPFAYITAFQKGLTPDTVVFDLPTEFAAQNPNCPTKVDFLNTNKECYHPENFDGVFRGPVSLREGLGQSINIPSIKTLYLAGLDDTLKNAQEFGLKTLTERSRYGLSLVLGGGEVTLANLVSAYSVLANDGVKNEQAILLKVSQEQKGRNVILEEFRARPKGVIDPRFVRMINDILSDIEVRSGLFESSLGLTIFPNHEVALKTGTTNDYRDAWAIGYTPSLVVGVWAGNNDNAPMKQRGSSLLAAIPMWNSFLKEALNKVPEEFFIRPEVVVESKPALQGEYIINNEVHSVLYYVDKKNPKGPAPERPAADSQFSNWEEPVREWVNQNIAFLTSIIESKLMERDLTLEIKSPLNGSFLLSGELPIEALAQSKLAISRLEIYFNNQLIDSVAPKESLYAYQKTFPLGDLELQNVLRLVVTDEGGGKKEQQVVLFR
jgi:penicillin-binding protein 1C